MENYRLRVFREVVAQMSFRKAAELLHLSQPAVSQQIRALEEECGARLFDRDGNQIALTEAGRVLLGYAISAAHLMEEARSALANLNHVVSGELHLGASTTIAQYILPRVLGGFHRQYPKVHLSLISGNTERIVEAVISGQVAMGIIEGPAMRRGLRTEPLMRDRMVLIAGAKDSLNRQPGRAGESAVLPISALSTVPLLLRERGSGSRRVVERALKQAGVALKSLRVAMELDSTEAIVSGVEAGLGVGFVSESAIGKELRLGTLRIVSLEGVVIERDFSLIHRAGQEPAGPAASFRRFAQFELGGSSR
jgi:DNA-binding transcriptional LysR family regulator